MCNVKRLGDCEQKIYIRTKDNKLHSSNWYSADLALDEALDKAKAELNINDDEIKSWNMRYNKFEEDTYYISKHAEKRLKERNGWNKKTQLRMMKKVIDNGKRGDEIKGTYKQIVKRVKDKYPAQEHIVYGDMLYIFNDKLLITVYYLKDNIIKKNKDTFTRDLQEEIMFT